MQSHRKQRSLLVLAIGAFVMSLPLSVGAVPVFTSDFISDGDRLQFTIPCFWGSNGHFVGALGAPTPKAISYHRAVGLAGYFQ